MSSGRRNGSGFKFACADAVESSKGKNVPRVYGQFAHQLADEVASMSLDTEQDGGWEEVVRKPRNRSAGNYGSLNDSKKVLSNAWTGSKGPTNVWQGNKGPATAWRETKVPASAWTEKGSASHSDDIYGSDEYDREGVVRKPINRSAENCGSLNDSKKVLSNAWAGSKGPTNVWQGKKGPAIAWRETKVPASAWTGKGSASDSDDIYDSDEYDIDDIQEGQETGKDNPSLKYFFETLDKMSIDEIKEEGRGWHCPACNNGKGGPGAIHWYKGLQPLINHAKTKGKTRVKVHREFAQLLEEELHSRGASVISSGEAFGKWRGLNDYVVRDRKIVWPPMVIIMNTKLDRDDNGKWLGMGNAELLEYFSAYEAVKSKHSYGPDGHRGTSVLIFEESAMGFMEAERLSKHFEDQGTDRDAWDHRRVLFLPGGQRQLYGFMAQKRDLDFFNQHLHGSSRLKFEMRSYQEMVVSKLKQMNEDNHLLQLYKNTAINEKRHSETIEASFGTVNEKLHKILAENRIIRERTKLLYQENKDEMNSQEVFFQKQIKKILNARNVEEENFEKEQQEHREKIERYMETPSTEDRESRIEKGTSWILYQQKEMDEFADERDKLLKDLEEKKAELKRQRDEEDLKLEEEYNAELVRLMKKYNHPH